MPVMSRRDISASVAAGPGILHQTTTLLDTCSGMGVLAISPQTLQIARLRNIEAIILVMLKTTMPAT